MLFDNRGNSDSENEEVSISPAGNSGGSGRDNETELSRGSKGSSSSSSGSDDSGIAIPSAEGDGSAVDESKVTLEDIHEQNKKIIGLLESINSDGSSGDSRNNDDSTDNLKGDIENELL